MLVVRSRRRLVAGATERLQIGQATSLFAALRRDPGALPDGREDEHRVDELGHFAALRVHL